MKNVYGPKGYSPRVLAVAALGCVLLFGATASAQDDGSWSLETYQSLSGAMEVADEDLALTVPGSPGWREASVAALEARRTLVGYISSAIRSGNMPDDFVAPATQARFVLVQNIISINTELGYCDQAEAALVMLRDVSDSSDAMREAYEVAQQDVDSCVPWVEPVVAAAPDPEPAPVVEPTPEPESQVAVAPPPVQTAPADVIAEPSPASNPRRTAGIALVATGGALLVGGLGWDIASAQGPRREFTDLSASCDGSEDCVDRLNELSESIDASKVPIGALTIGGAVIAVTGTVLWLTAPRERDAQRVSFAPEWRPGFVGATIGFR